MQAISFFVTEIFNKVIKNKLLTRCNENNVTHKCYLFLNVISKNLASLSKNRCRDAVMSNGCGIV